MRSTLSTLLLALSMLWIAACGKTASSLGNEAGDGSRGICNTIYTYGLALQLSVPSGINVSQLRVSIQDGSYQEIKTASDGYSVNGVLSIPAAGERPGTYQVTVTHPNLQTAVVSNIVVSGDRCHVNSQSVSIPLH